MTKVVIAYAKQCLLLSRCFQKRQKAYVSWKGLNRFRDSLTLSVSATVKDEY